MSDNKPRLDLVSAADALRRLSASLPAGSRLRLELPPGSTIDVELGTLSQVARALGGDALEGAANASSAFPSATALVEAGQGEMTVREAGEQLGISRQAVLSALHRGRLQGRQVGSFYLVSASSVAAYKRDPGTIGHDDPRYLQLIRVALDRRRAPSLRRKAIVIVSRTASTPILDRLLSHDEELRELEKHPECSEVVASAIYFALRRGVFPPARSALIAPYSKLRADAPLEAHRQALVEQNRRRARKEAKRNAPRD